jgi:hypothetical protein
MDRPWRKKYKKNDGLALHLLSVIPYLDLNDTLANLIGDMLGGQDGEPME